eukprot:5682414-Amphidinium_carterae.1
MSYEVGLTNENARIRCRSASRYPQQGKPRQRAAPPTSRWSLQTAVHPADVAANAAKETRTA